MSTIDFILEKLKERMDRPALLWRHEVCTGADLAARVGRDLEFLSAHGIVPGSVVILRGDYSPRTVSLLLALIERKTVVAPLLPATLERAPELIDVVNPSFIIDAAGDTPAIVSRRETAEAQALVRSLQKDDRPGLILFTSGTSGQPKGVVHDFERLLAKFRQPRPAMRTLNFLLFDHWGGLNTLLHCLANGSAVVLPENRKTDSICELLERHQVELLPASPTFLRLLLLSKAYEGRDLTALRLITYGSEPMAASTLMGLKGAFPGVELRQTYGLIELGVLRAKSLSSDSLWVKVGGEGYDLRVVEGILQIKAESAMLGYLNAPAPFTDDGYFITGDRVERNGEYLRILGRESELINVGGQKVFPAEIETVLLECELVSDAVVYGQPNPIIGTIVCADVRLRRAMDETEARGQLKRFCGARLDPYKVPVKIRFLAELEQSDRGKRKRPGPESTPDGST